MEEIKLDVQKRKVVGKKELKAVRNQDLVPGVVYGGEENPEAIKVDRRTYERIMRHHKGQSVIFHLNVMEGEQKTSDCSTIVKEEQHDPVSDKLLHIDFQRISLTEEIEVKVPILLRGEAKGVKKDGGNLEHILWEIDVICMPTDIPEKIEIDVSEMNIGDTVHVKDLAMPSGVRTEHDPDGIVLALAAPRAEEPEEPTEEEAASVEPEVIKEKKAKEEASAEKSEKTEE